MRIDEQKNYEHTYFGIDVIYIANTSINKITLLKIAN